MGKLAVFKYVSFMFLVFTIVLMVFTLAALFGGMANPATNHGLAMLVYALPLFIAANVLLVAYWMFRRRWYWQLMPLFCVLCCLPYIGTFYKPAIFNKGDATQSGLIVATYNVANFGRETSGFKSGDILAEMRKNGVDILCMQEYNDVSGDRLNSDFYKEYFPYHKFGRNDMIIYSRYPIKQAKTINFDSDTNNSAMWADIDLKGKVIRVFNVHLETTGFNRSLHKVAKMEMQGQDVKENAVIRLIYDNYTMGMIARSHQCQLVAEHIEETTLPIIVCGDFNDVPYSYTYRTMLGDMVDGFKECGHGYMGTYRNWKNLRIDYIFHDKSLRGLDYYKADLSYSDHDPVFMKIKL